jgi:hypothetical protein
MSPRRSRAATIRVGLGVAMLAAATTFLVGGQTTPAFASGPALVQTGSVVTSSTRNITLTLSSGSTSGNLLIATISGYGDSSNSTGPAGWTSAVQTSGGGNRRTAIWYYANNPGGITSAAFTFGASTTFIAGQISEWSGMGTGTPLDITNRNNSGSGTTFNLTSGGATTIMANEIAVTAFQEDLSSASTVSFTPGGGWTNFGNTGPTSGTTQYTADYETGLTNGASPSETQTSSVSGLGRVARRHRHVRASGHLHRRVAHPRAAERRCAVQRHRPQRQGPDRQRPAVVDPVRPDRQQRRMEHPADVDAVRDRRGTHPLDHGHHGHLGQPKYDGRDLHPAH